MSIPVIFVQGIAISLLDIYKLLKLFLEPSPKTVNTGTENCGIISLLYPVHITFKFSQIYRTMHIDERWIY